MLKLEKCTLYLLPSKAKQHTNMCHSDLLLDVKISYKNVWSTDYDSKLATWESMIGINIVPFIMGLLLQEQWFCGK